MEIKSKEIFAAPDATQRVHHIVMRHEEDFYHGVLSCGQLGVAWRKRRKIIPLPFCPSVP